MNTKEIKPEPGMMVSFGHLCLKSERSGTIVSVDPLGTCRVRVQFLPEDEQKEIVHEVGGCTFFAEKPKVIKGGSWQYCYPDLSSRSSDFNNDLEVIVDQ